MERIEDKPEERLMVAIFEEKGSNCYPYIVIEEEGKKTRIELMTAIQEALTTVSLKEKKALEFRFGLLDSKPRTLREVGQELLGVTGSRAQQIVVKALRKLRYPSRSRVLRQFFIPSPEEINHLKKEINRLRDENRSLLEGIKPENLASAAQVAKEERDRFEALVLKFPNKRIWNVVRRYFCYQLSRDPSILGIKEQLVSGEIRKARNFGGKTEQFLREVFRQIEKEASP